MASRAGGEFVDPHLWLGLIAFFFVRSSISPRVDT